MSKTEWKNTKNVMPACVSKVSSLSIERNAVEKNIRARK
jgi:hypothetical protein